MGHRGTRGSEQRTKHSDVTLSFRGLGAQDTPLSITPAAGVPLLLPHRLPQSQTEWAQLLESQQKYHDTELQKWREIIKSSVMLLDQVRCPYPLSLPQSPWDGTASLRKITISITTHWISSFHSSFWAIHLSHFKAVLEWAVGNTGVFPKITTTEQHTGFTAEKL